MSKKCPYCSHEMESGYIQCRDGVSWTKKKKAIAALPSSDASSTILASGGGPFSGAAVEAYRCRECKTIIINYSE